MLESLLTGGIGHLIGWSGPGEKILHYGSPELGIFGEVSAEDFLTAKELEQYGYGESSANIVWVKAMYLGKVLFVPVYYTTPSEYWSRSYSRGLIFGVNDYGPVPETVRSVNQYVPAVVKGTNFIIRALKGSTLDPDTGEVTEVGSEFNEIIYNIVRDGMVPRTKLGFQKYTWSNLIGTSANPPLASISDTNKAQTRNRTGKTTNIEFNAPIAPLPIFEVVRGQHELVVPVIRTFVKGLDPLTNFVLSTESEDGLGSRLVAPHIYIGESESLSPLASVELQPTDLIVVPKSYMNESHSLKPLESFELNEILEGESNEDPV